MKDGIGYDASSCSDRVDTIEDLIAKDDRVWAVWTMRGTHTGQLFGIPPTGKPIEILEVGIWRLADGLVIEAWFLVTNYASFASWVLSMTPSSVPLRRGNHSEGSARPPRSASSSEASTLGESNRGQQKKSTVPSLVTRAHVCRSPMSPWLLMFG